MKKIHVSIAALFVSALLLSCQKEAVSPIDSNPGNPIGTILRFNIGEVEYELDAIRNTEFGVDDCDILIQNSNYVDNNCSSWNQYHSNSEILTIARQDDPDTPNVRLAFAGKVDLETADFPVLLSEPVLAVSDLGRTIIPIIDDSELGTSALGLKSNTTSAEIIVTSRKGNMIEGTFQGTVFAINGTAVEITEGTFVARLNWDE